MDLNALKTELLANHPVSGAYDADAVLAAVQINTVDVTKDRTSISPGELQAAVVGSEFGLLSAVEQRAWLAILSDDVDPNNANIVAQIATLWGAGTTTRDNLVALKTKPASRADELDFGRVTAGDIERARAL